MYNEGLGEPPCNYALYDGRNAFLWIKRNIAAFGGDPERITAFGLLSPFHTRPRTVNILIPF